ASPERVLSGSGRRLLPELRRERSVHDPHICRRAEAAAVSPADAARRPDRTAIRGRGRKPRRTPPPRAHRARLGAETPRGRVRAGGGRNGRGVPSMTDLTELTRPEPVRAMYLRWRPKFFREVVGQEAVVRTLRNAVARSAVAHGYLLCGPRGTGKTTLARILFKALNCAQPLDGEPCGECHSCVTCDAGRAIDLTEIDAASNRGIDDIRALRERVRFAPAEASWKVYIVDEAHQLTAPAWDAFLKTLEEPPPHTVFVLATTAAHKVPATIVSRCQRFDLGRIPQPIIADQLARVAVMEGI